LATLLALACAASPWAAEQMQASGPRLDWMLNCQGCHRSDAVGTPGRVPTIKNQVARFLSVDGGREFLIRVPGVASSPLSDAATAELVNWMLREFDPEHLPDDFEPYTPDEIAGLRKRPLVDVLSVRGRLVAELKRTEY
jgi:hypothetical protein